MLWATHLTDEVRDEDRLIVLHQAHILADGLTKEIRGGSALKDKFLNLTGASA